MKLTNPTDAELNAAFAEKVAGWFRAERMGKQVLYDPEGGHVIIGDTRCMPPFIISADAVLPWLEHHYSEIKYWTGAAGERPCWLIRTEGEPATRQGGQGDGQSFARAATIALLRAHGVEVEFTQ